MGTKPMTREEAIIRIKDHMRHHGIGIYPHIKLAEAFNMAISALSSMSAAEPLTAEQLRKMHFELVWFVYPPQYEGDSGGCEEGVVLYGKLYSIDSLEGAGFEEMLLDAEHGDDPDRPSGNYQVFRRIAGVCGNET